MLYRKPALNFMISNPAPTTIETSELLIKSLISVSVVPSVDSAFTSIPNYRPSIRQSKDDRVQERRPQAVADSPGGMSVVRQEIHEELVSALSK